MTLLGGLFEQRTSIEDPTVPLTAGTMLSYLAGPQTSAGVRVDQKNALRQGAVWRCVALLSGVAASLPLKAYRTGTRQEAPSLLLDSPHPDLTPFEFWRLSYVHRLLWGNSFGQYQRDGMGRTRSIWLLDPARMQVGRAADGAKVYKYTDSRGDIYVMDDSQILHIPGLGFDGVAGLSPIGMARTTIGAAIAAEQYASDFFGRGSLMAGILTTPQRLTQDVATRLQQSWQEKTGGGLANAYKIPVLDSDTKFTSLTMPNDDAQFLESRKFEIEEIARWYGIPPHMLGEVDRSTSWGAGIEQQVQGFVTFTLSPDWLVPTEQRVTQSMTGSEVYAKYKIDGLLRGDSVTRAQFYQVMLQNGVFSRNYVRDLEDLDAVPGGDAFLQPLNMGTQGASATQGGANA